MKVERAEQILSLQLGWVQAADSKIPSLFAINIAMIGVIAALLKLAPSLTNVQSVITVLCITCIIISIGSLVFSMFPKLNGPKSSNIYFGGITKQAEDKFKNDIIGITDEEYLDDLLNQVYRNAEIADNKYGYVKISYIFTFVSFPIWAVAVYLLYV